MSRARATFAAGCFWGVEHTFRQVPGVLSAQVGYTGGTAEEPTYQQVCGGGTGHAEAVELRYDPQQVSYQQLLEVFWGCHDPTTLNRQGPDVGSQYRSAVFFHDADQEREARQALQQLEGSGRLARPVVTEISPAGSFFRAEEYHQRYFEKNGVEGCSLG